MRVFLDANILFMAAWKPAGPVTRLFDLQDAQFCTLLSSTYAALEVRRNIAAKAPDQAALLEHRLEFVELTTLNNPAHLATAATFAIPDPSDVPILGAAIQTHADILITADARAFGHLYRKRCAGVEILRLEDAFLRIIDQPLR